jgi:hypothetical protein
MPDIAGAMEAIEQRLRDNWTTSPIILPNEGEQAAFVDGAPVPWVLFEIENEEGDIIGAGKPGSHVNVDRGSIVAKVFVPTGVGLSTARTHATAIGEIFRVKEFYRSSGFCVRTWKPHVGRALPARSENPEGLWFCVTVTIPFEFISIA